MKHSQHLFLFKDKLPYFFLQCFSILFSNRSWVSLYFYVLFYIFLYFIVISQLYFFLHVVLKIIWINQPTHNSMLYHPPRHRKNENHAFKYFHNICERQNRGPVPTTRIECGCIDEWSTTHLYIFLGSSFHCSSSDVWSCIIPLH
jgi:hypothetical protein